MEMQQLRYVVAVARTGNFSRAAEQCHVAQPSLSQQIQKLEEELGERLFDRLKREVKMTPHGEAFLRRAVRILEEVDAAKREATDARDLLRGTLMIGVLPTIAPYLLPAVLAAFMKKFRGVEIVVHEDTTARLLKLAHSYEIDFALASQPIQDERLEVRKLFSEELLLALPPRPSSRPQTPRDGRRPRGRKFDRDERRPLPRRSGARFLRATGRETENQFSQRATRNRAGARRSGFGPFAGSRDGGAGHAQGSAKVSFAPVTETAAKNCRRLAKATFAGPRRQRIFETGFPALR